MEDSTRKDTGKKDFEKFSQNPGTHRRVQVTLRSAASFYLLQSSNTREPYQGKDVYLSTPS